MYFTMLIKSGARAFEVVPVEGMSYLRFSQALWNHRFEL